MHAVPDGGEAIDAHVVRVEELTEHRALVRRSGAETGALQGTHGSLREQSTVIPPEMNGRQKRNFLVY